MWCFSICLYVQQVLLSFLVEISASFCLLSMCFLIVCDYLTDSVFCHFFECFYLIKIYVQAKFILVNNNSGLTKVHVKSSKPSYNYNKSCLYSLCENYFHTTGQSDRQFLNLNLSWLIFTCHIIEYRAKVNPKFLPVTDTFCLTLTWHRQGLPGIDMAQTRFAWHWPVTDKVCLTLTCHIQGLSDIDLSQTRFACHWPGTKSFAWHWCSTDKVCLALTWHRHGLPDIDLSQTRFAWHWPATDKVCLTMTCHRQGFALTV